MPPLLRGFVSVRGGAGAQLPMVTSQRVPAGGDQPQRDHRRHQCRSIASLASTNARMPAPSIMMPRAAAGAT
jgi:hypothetical protein